MPTDEPSGRRISSFLDSAPPADRDAAAEQHAKAVEMFGLVLEEWIAPETPDAEIVRAFRYLLAEWRRTAPERAEAERERQRLDQEARAEQRRYWQEHPEEAPRPMIDPARLFETTPMRARLERSPETGLGRLRTGATAQSALPAQQNHRPLAVPLGPFKRHSKIYMIEYGRWNHALKAVLLFRGTTYRCEFFTRTEPFYRECILEHLGAARMLRRLKRK